MEPHTKKPAPNRQSHRLGGRDYRRGSYYDIVIRDDRALAAIRAYIRDNPANYGVVVQCGEPRHLGNLKLLALPKLGFLASRGGEDKPHAPLPLRHGEAALSGFLSPMERAVFRVGLANKKPLIWVTTTVQTLNTFDHATDWSALLSS